MKKIEQQIIAACLHEDRYNEVSFLEPKDFTNYPGSPCRDSWAVIQENKGQDIFSLDALKKIPEKIKYFVWGSDCEVVGYMKHQSFALLLLEIRFKTLLSDLLSQLSIKTKNALERDILNEALLLVPKEDIFDLSDNILEYIGHHASDYTKHRIESFLEYRNKRVEQAKLTLNVTK